MENQMSKWVQILERTTEYKSARKHGKERSQKDHFSYILVLAIVYLTIS